MVVPLRLRRSVVGAGASFAVGAYAVVRVPVRASRPGGLILTRIAVAWSLACAPFVDAGSAGPWGAQRGDHSLGDGVGAASRLAPLAGRPTLSRPCHGLPSKHIAGRGLAGVEAPAAGPLRAPGDRPTLSEQAIRKPVPARRAGDPLRAPAKAIGIGIPLSLGVVEP